MKTQNILIWAAIIGGGIYLYNRNKKKKAAEAATTESATQVDGIMNEEMAKVFSDIRKSCAGAYANTKMAEAAKAAAIDKCAEAKFEEYMHVNTKIV